ncbi:MAG: thioredoxin family protein [Pseudomonadota bacterium]
MVSTPVCDFGWQAPAFSLPDLDGKTHDFSGIQGEHGTLIMFICNHCPYVRAIEDRIARDTRDLAGLGIGVAAICSNDLETYTEDGPDGLRGQSARAGFDFPYLLDESQAVARAYDAACTPDFFGFDAAGGLQYRGRLDASRASAGPVDLRRDLYEAMRQVAETGQGPKDQVPSVGCSIKWKRA